MNWCELQSFGFVSNNPLMKNITDYLVDEGSYEEEILLGKPYPLYSQNALTFKLCVSMRVIIIEQNGNEMNCSSMINMMDFHRGSQDSFSAQCTIM